MVTFIESFDRLQRFHTKGTITEFLAWVDSPEGKDWLDPNYENWLIRRDTVRQAGLAVMRRTAEEFRWFMEI